MTEKSRPIADPRSLVDRLGLTAAGLEALSPTGVRAWLDRVRATDLSAAEYRATLKLVYRTWMVALLFKALGSGWDVAWHFRFNRDDFAPPHDVNLVGDGIAIVLVLCHVYTRFGVDKLALRLLAGGAALFVISAPIDVINHRINGLDITSWSITHFGLYTGTAIMIAGVIRGWRLHAQDLPNHSIILGVFWLFFFENVWFPNQHQEYGVEEIASWDRGHPFAERSLLDFAANQIGRAVDRDSVVHFSLPVHSWVYPVWATTAAMLTLLIARRGVGLRFTATTIAAGYVVWRCVMWPLLAGVGFPISALPLFIVAGGVAIDLVCLRELAWPVEALAGTVLTTAALYVAVFVQSATVVAPPISYWSAPAAALILLAGWSALSALRTHRQLIHF
jgi:hypothetical protein